MAYEFLKPVLTPNALATIQANPVLLAYFLGWLSTITFLISLVLYINFQTSKAYAKPADPKAPKKNVVQNLLGKVPFLK